jgi:hypothetical protein
MQIVASIARFLLLLSFEFDVTAEFLPHRGQHFFGKRVFLA